MIRHFVVLVILFASMTAQARLPYGTGLEAEASKLVTCRLTGYSTTPGGPQSSVYVDVMATSLEDAVRKAVATQTASSLAYNGDISLLQIDMGNGKSIWAESIICGDVNLRVADCCKAVCGTCIR